jgi:hypothetical protein
LTKPITYLFETQFDRVVEISVCGEALFVIGNLSDSLDPESIGLDGAISIVLLKLLVWRQRMGTKWRKYIV